MRGKSRHFGTRPRNSLYVDLLSPTSILTLAFKKFYFRGLKLVVTHRRHATALQARVKAGGEPLSRWELRFIQTNKTDLARYHLLLQSLRRSYSHRSRPRLV